MEWITENLTPIMVAAMLAVGIIKGVYKSRKSYDDLVALVKVNAKDIKDLNKKMKNVLDENGRLMKLIVAKIAGIDLDDVKSPEKEESNDGE